MDIRQIRKDLHQIPELGRCEYKTRDYILNFAKKLNCKIYQPTETAVVLYFHVQKEHTICFRADMDGLPICEHTHLSFSSKHNGNMHACGHDGHMAILLSFAEWASLHQEALEYNIVCLFQPSEEDNAGARDILLTGILEELKIEKIFGMHIWPNLKKGQLYTMPGGMLASSAELDIHFYGQAVHAANRLEGKDALQVSALFLMRCYQEMESIPHRHLISFGKLSAGEVRNAVAGEAHLLGTLRTFDDAVFLQMEQKLRDLGKQLACEFGVRIEIKINAVYPSVQNDKELVEEYQDILNYIRLEQPFLQAEDFGCYTRKYKSLFLLLGCGNEHMLHTHDFDFDMDILSTGLNAYQKIACYKKDRIS